MAGQSGGTSWTSAWVSDSNFFPTLAANGAGLTYTGLNAAGGKTVWSNGPQQVNAARCDLPLVNSGVVHLQFPAQFGAQSGGGTPTVRLFAAAVLTGGIGGNGNNGNCPGTSHSILDNSLSPAADGASCTAASVANLSRVVVQIDYANVVTKMWINFVLATFDYVNPPAPQPGPRLGIEWQAHVDILGDLFRVLGARRFTVLMRADAC